MTGAGLCDRRGCSKPAEFQVVVRVYAPRSLDPARQHPVDLEYGLVVCSGCGGNISPAELLTPDARSTFAGIFEAIGKVKPSWDSARVELRPLEPAMEV